LVPSGRYGDAFETERIFSYALNYQLHGVVAGFLLRLDKPERVCFRTPVTRAFCLVCFRKQADIGAKQGHYGDCNYNYNCKNNHILSSGGATHHSPVLPKVIESGA
jgi:hypothetical protein